MVDRKDPLPVTRQCALLKSTSLDVLPRAQAGVRRGARADEAD